MAEEKKRKAPAGGNDTASKKSKTKKLWQVTRKNPRTFPQSGSIEPGDAGIWATCERGKEAKAVGELKDLFQEYAEKLYGIGSDDLKGGADGGENDIEADIQQELDEMQKPKDKPLFANVRMDIQCVLFIKTRAPVEPVSFVHAICKDAATTGKKRTRFVMRLSPMTVMAKATEGGLLEIAKTVLAPHFHDGNESKKFAIRPTLRNCGKVLSRDLIIKKVAEVVGPDHKVDLSNYDSLILVEVYRNICGISVVPGDYEELKRYNIAELCEPTPVPASQAAEGKSVAVEGEAAEEATSVDVPVEASAEVTTAE